MNTTFTTYAEKKAKQFLNLLQGYTKGIRMTAILILLLMGVSNAWGANNEYGNNKVIYLDITNGSTTNGWRKDQNSLSYKIKMYYNNSDKSEEIIGEYCCTRIGTSNIYYTTTNNDYVRWVQALRCAGNCGTQYNYSSRVSCASRSYNHDNCIILPTDNADWWDTWTPTWTCYVPGISFASLSNASTIYGGEGTKDKPYQIAVSSTLSVNASATSIVPADNAPSKEYQFSLSTNSGTRTTKQIFSTNNSYSFTASASAGTTYAIDVEARNNNNSNIGKETATSSTLYFITIEPIYAILGSFNDWTHSGNTWDLSDQGSNNWKATFHLDKGSHTFKVVYNSSYYGKDNTTITRASATASSLSTSEANINLTTDIAGDYTFTFNSSTKNLTVTYPTAYTLTYGSGAGGSGTVTADNSIKSGDLVLAGTSVSLTATPASGYDFAAWYSDQACESAVVSSNNPYNFSINSNTTLYAKWTAKTYAVTLNPQSGTGGTTSVTATYGSAMPAITKPTRTGYTFNGYYDATSGGTQYYKPDGTSAKNWDKTTDATLYAHWIPTEYNITYELNGGTNHASNPKTYNITQEITLQDPTYTGHIFKGWFDNADFTGDAILSISAGSTGAKTFYAKWEIGTYEITLDLQQGTGGTQTISATFGSEMPAIITPTREGYLFNGYYDQTGGKGTKYYDETGKNIKNWNKESATLYAYWIPYSKCIFFKNTLDWKNVYVYTFSNNVWYDNEDSNTKYGPGVCTKTQNNLHYGEMTQIGESDIFYFILPNTTGFNYIAFSDFPMNDWNEFYGHNAIYRSDRSDQMQLFIPQKEQSPSTTNSTKYYSSGIWMKYNSTESGYDWRGATDENNQEQWSNSFAFTASKPGGYSFTATVEFDNTSTHYFKIHNTKGDWFGNGGTMTQNNCTDWTFGTNNTENAKITPTITGKYIFTVYLGDGEVKVSLDYPLSVGDYRLAYTDNTKDSYHPGHYLKKHSTTQTDTVSFFIHHNNQQPKIFVEECTNITDGKPKWDKVNEITNNPAASITESGVYNFFLQQIEGQTTPTLVNEAMPYTGNYYIRTDAADGGWDSFRQKSNQITYSSFADGQLNSNFNHYYCKYIEAGRNVKFTIANDYSYCISDTLDNDDIIKEGQSSIGCLPINANVRFGWDSNTNEISRAYIKGAGMTSDRFLVLQGNEHLKDANGNDIPEGDGDRTGLLANEEILVDQQNWIYQVDVTANNQTFVKLIAEYNGKIQYFKGDDKEYTRLLSSNASKNYTIRLVYDFKSNHLVTAWLAGGNTVANTEILGADMMVIRKDQNQADQLNFNPQNSSMMNSVKTGYAVMTFTQPHITDNTKTERERSLYWVSFPFDVKVSDVFGFGEYAEHWILQYYDGAERAKKGLFSDSGTYWKYIFDTDTKLKAGEGYVLVLDLNKIEFLHGAEEVSLYFPSIDELNTISGEPTAATIPAHECTIDREWTEGGTRYHHKYTDSHWNLIGVPGFADIDFDLAKTGYHFMQNDASFYYNFNLAESTYAVETSQVTKFQAMYAYMVQFAGTINWTSSEVSGVAPPELVAPRNSDAEPEKVVLRLELAQGEEEEDHTFVQLQQEGATANFDLSLDLTKIMNSGFSNIYTLTDSLKIQVAGNALPMEETVVPVGVNIAAAGEYTFRMPDGTEGMVVELIDYETNTRTNLLLSDYTVNLPAGSNETRFALSIKPEKTATNVGNIGGTMNDGQGVRKFIIDGKLYLQKDGLLYDAQGHIVR